MVKNAPSPRKAAVAPSSRKRPTPLTERRSNAGDASAERLSPNTTWQRRHLLDLDDFSAAEIAVVLDTADAMKEVLARDVPRVPALRGKTIVTLFYEASTRTRASFELAGKVLGADVINVSVAGSSVQKGEALLDTIRTIQAIGADVCILRHHSSGAPYLAARESTFRVINAGDGGHAHPTQALLDAYTLRSKLGDLRGRKIVIVGDIAHSRVARSNMWSLTTLGAEVVLCGPPTLLPAGLNGAAPDAEERDLPPVRVEHDLDVAIEGADAVMALRLQRERQSGGLLPSLREYARLYQVNAERMAMAKPGALVLHPGPINEGVEISTEVAHGSRSVVEEQVANGVAVRMAVLYLLLRGEQP
ncbi:MAG: aspartate carbamoyltransferase catalytic subunit [Chloroflexi bacterium]|nr:aspartate carbamoyltransferase catalytic subunit [Chloroflexota bacterium]